MPESAAKAINRRKISNINNGGDGNDSQTTRRCRPGTYNTRWAGFGSTSRNGGTTFMCVAAIACCSMPACAKRTDIRSRVRCPSRLGRHCGRCCFEPSLTSDINYLTEPFDLILRDIFDVAPAAQQRYRQRLDGDETTTPPRPRHVPRPPLPRPPRPPLRPLLLRAIMVEKDCWLVLLPFAVLRDGAGLTGAHTAKRMGFGSTVDLARSALVSGNS